MKKTLRFTEKDNVVVALEEINVGDEVLINGEISDVVALEHIPQGHKIAIRDIAEGADVEKYGHVIGTAKSPIKAGMYVHNHNVADMITDWRHNIVHEYDPASVTEISDEFIIEKPPKLTGYRRSDGSVGFRNYVLVVSTCVCSNQPVDELKVLMHDCPDVVFITNPSGCVILPNEVEMQYNMLYGLAKNPNVGAVVFVSLGCENIMSDELYNRIKDEKPAAFYIAQNDGSCMETAENIKKKVVEFREILSHQQREEVSVADIRIGVQCGASDWTTAAAANPSIGYCSDLIVKNGGISIIGETCGWFGGEGVLIKQCRTKETADKIVEVLSRIYDRAIIYGRRIEEANPSPGNYAGGISTLCEKALGNTRKGGTAPVEGMLGVGEQPHGPGFYVSDNPGLDPTSVFAQTMSSCNVVVYSTGRGSPVGTPIAPVIKLTAPPTAASRFGAHMDVVLTDLVLDGVPIAAGGWRLFDKVIAVCNGEQSIAEKHGHREYSFPLMMGPM